MIKLILADGNEITRIGLRTILENSDVEIIAEVSSSDELIDQLSTKKVDVVMIDYTSQNFSLDAIPKAISIQSSAKFLAITPLQSGKALRDALKSGLFSHIKKDCSLEEIIDAVKQTSIGEKFFCGELLEVIAKEDINIEQLEDAIFSCDSVTISEREIEIITLISDGFTNGQISEKLFLSKHTVSTHRKNIMAKLGVKNTAGIVMYAVRESYNSPNKFLFAPNKDD